LIGSTLLFLYTLAYAGSKSSLLVLGVVMFFIFIVRFKDILSTMLTARGIAAMILIFSIGIGGAIYMSQTSAVKGMAERSKSTGTMQQRFIIWRAGSEMIRDNFFLGVGFAQFPKVSGNYIKDYLPPEALPSHNNFIKVFAESGVFSFITFFMFIMALFTNRAREVYRSDYFWIYVGSLSAVLMSLTIPSLHHKDYWFTIALVSHVIYIFYKKEEKSEELPI
jgi:O-antigen ligase